LWFILVCPSVNTKTLETLIFSQPFPELVEDRRDECWLVVNVAGVVRMTLTTVFVNKTTVDFKLKEGNAGVYREVTTLKGLDSADATPSEKNKHALEFDEKATYREYRTVSRPGGQKIQITSDFCLDHSTIYIVPKPDTPEKFGYDGDLRLKPEAKPGQFNLFGSLSKFFSKKS
jgi:hypothetical protein